MWNMLSRLTANKNRMKAKKKEMHLVLSRELKIKLWNMKVKVTPDVTGAFCTVTK